VSYLANTLLESSRHHSDYVSDHIRRIQVQHRWHALGKSSDLWALN
jgi:hypothetical protein